jgi:CRISPR-associated endonuclease/helicase Cas3
VSKSISFDEAFHCLTEHLPFPWQEELYRRFLQGEFPSPCNLPTGLGKTSILAVWLLALVEEPRRVPRRLVYVVNRRTVVDQATDEAVKLRKRLEQLPGIQNVLRGLVAFKSDKSDVPLAISTLRGQFADNGEWLDDPARPAIIVGTVDMIGSRLLFSGYRCGFKTKPTHAALLGRDSLIVHDEAHLEPAFQSLLESISSQQRHDDPRRIRVLELTATSRGNGEAAGDPNGNGESFTLTDADKQHEEVRKRIFARKGIRFHDEIEDEKRTADAVAEQALSHRDSGEKVLVFLRTVDAVEKVVARLAKEKMRVASLTGTLRGLERDVLTGVRPAEPESELSKIAGIFARFLPLSKDEPSRIAPTEGTVYLVCTAAGEVGVNISADHLVCDLTPFDSMAQRFGRVNRFGDGDARIDITHEAEIEPKSAFHVQRRKTLDLLRQLPSREDGRFDASPAALRACLKSRASIAICTRAGGANWSS